MGSNEVTEPGTWMLGNFSSSPAMGWDGMGDPVNS